jgi:hypothetical protein
MNKYTVKSTDGTYNIIADTWSVGVEGLKFYIWDELPKLGDGIEDKKEYQRWVIAWFTTWDYWLCESEDFYSGLDEIKKAYIKDKFETDPLRIHMPLRNLVHAITRHILGVQDENKPS